MSLQDNFFWKFLAVSAFCILLAGLVFAVSSRDFSLPVFPSNPVVVNNPIYTSLGRSVQPVSVNVTVPFVGWNIFSMPVVPTQPITPNIIDQSCHNLGNSVIWRYNPFLGKYEVLDNNANLEAGIGYWIRVSQSCSFAVYGNAFAISDGLIGGGTIKQKWNLIGSPSQEIDFNSAKGNCIDYADINGAKRFLMYSYDNGKYVEAHNFVPGKGYFLYGVNECSLSVESPEIVDIGPVIAAGLIVPQIVPENSDFQIEAVLKNVGDLPALNNAISLHSEIPFNNDVPDKVIDSIEPNESKKLSWSVKTNSLLGEKPIDLSLNGIVVDSEKIEVKSFTDTFNVLAGLYHNIPVNTEFSSKIELVNLSDIPVKNVVVNIAESPVAVLSGASQTIPLIEPWGRKVVEFKLKSNDSKGFANLRFWIKINEVNSLSVENHVNVQDYSDLVKVLIDFPHDVSEGQNFQARAKVYNNSDAPFVDVPMQISLPSGIDFDNDSAIKNISKVQVYDVGEIVWNLKVLPNQSSITRQAEISSNIEVSAFGAVKDSDPITVGSNQFEPLIKKNVKKFVLNFGKIFPDWFYVPFDLVSEPVLNLAFKKFVGSVASFAAYDIDFERDISRIRERMAKNSSPESMKSFDKLMDKKRQEHYGTVPQNSAPVQVIENLPTAVPTTNSSQNTIVQPAQTTIPNQSQNIVQSNSSNQAVQNVVSTANNNQNTIVPAQNFNSNVVNSVQSNVIDRAGAFVDAYSQKASSLGISLKYVDSNHYEISLTESRSGSMLDRLNQFYYGIASSDSRATSPITVVSDPPCQAYYYHIIESGQFGYCSQYCGISGTNLCSITGDTVYNSDNFIGSVYVMCDSCSFKSNTVATHKQLCPDPQCYDGFNYLGLYIPDGSSWSGFGINTTYSTTAGQYTISCNYGTRLNYCGSTVVCSQNSDCGTDDGYIGQPFCYDNDLYNSYWKYVCNNPGTTTSYCNHTSDLIKQQECSNGCTSGNNSCNSAPSCDSGTCSSQNYYDLWEYYCKNSTDKWTHRKYNIFGCVSNSCQLQSSNYVNDQFAETCSYGCENGTCKPASACDSSSCNQQDNYGSWEYYCSGNDKWQHRIFNDFGCSSNSCQLISSNYAGNGFAETCFNGCNNGLCSQGSACNETTCSQNDNYGGWEYYCYENQRWKQQKSYDYSCNNNSCSLSSGNYINQSIVENCSNGCSNGFCNQLPAWDKCTSSNPCSAYNGDCDTDNDCQTGLKCVENVGNWYGYTEPIVDVCLPASNYSIALDDFPIEVEEGMPTSIVWKTSQIPSQTEIQWNYNSKEGSYHSISSSQNGLQNIAFLTPSIGRQKIYFRAYALINGENVFSEWQEINVIQNPALHSTTEKIVFTPAEFDVAGLGVEAVKILTIGSCLDDGWITVWCFIDVVSTGTMVAGSISGPEIGLLKLFSKSAEVVKTAIRLDKLFTIITKWKTVINSRVVEVSSDVMRVLKDEHGAINVIGETGEVSTRFVKIAEQTAKYGTTALDRLKQAGATNEMIETVLKTNVKITKIEKIYTFEKVTAWLHVDKLKHIIDKHVYGIIGIFDQRITTFFPTGETIKIGDQIKMLPITMTKEDIPQLIGETLAKGTAKLDGGDWVVVAEINNYGIREMKVVVDAASGFIRTAHPLNGPAVYVWDDVAKIFKLSP